jgi:hypothetical protein
VTGGERMREAVRRVGNNGVLPPLLIGSSSLPRAGCSQRHRLALPRIVLRVGRGAVDPPGLPPKRASVVTLARCPLEAALEPFLHVPHVPRHLLCACRRTTRGPSSLPSHAPRSRARSSRAIVPRHRGARRCRLRPPCRTIDAAHGPASRGSILVISIVIVRSPRPILRVVTAFEPTAGGSPPSVRELTTLSCQGPPHTAGQRNTRACN